MADRAASVDAVDAFVQRVTDSQDFPALSERIRDVMQLASGEDATMQRLANIILKDYGLTTKVLRTANSFRYNRAGTPILSVTQAMVLLGMDNVRDLATGLLVFEHYQRRSPGLKELMLLSMLTASHARETADYVGSRRTEESRLRGMFRNLGEILVASHSPTEYAAIMALVQERKVRPSEACVRQLGFTCEELGDAVCRLWGIPMHAQPLLPAEREELDRVVAFSHELTTSVYRREGGESPATLRGLLQKYGAALGLTADTIQAVLQRGLAETRDVFDGLGMSVSDLKLRRQCESALAGLAAGPPPEPVGAARAEPEPMGLTRHRLVSTIRETVAGTAGFDLNQVLLTILEAIFRAGPFDHAVFCVASPDRREVAGRFGLGDDVEAWVERTRFPVSSHREAAPAGPALSRGIDLILSSATNPSADQDALLRRLGVGTVVLLPILVEGKLVGALYADRVHSDTPPDADTMTFLERARDLAAGAVAQARGRAEARTRRPPLSPAGRCEAVLRVLRGETAEAVARDTGVLPGEVEAWREAFLAGAMGAMKDA